MIVFHMSIYKIIALYMSALHAVLWANNVQERKHNAYFAIYYRQTDVRLVLRGKSCFEWVRTDMYQGHGSTFTI